MAEGKTTGRRDMYEVRLGDEEPFPKYTFMSRGTGSSPIGDIIAIKAKSKNGKTFLAAILASVVLGARFSSLEATMPDESMILYFDTEQNRPNAQALLQRIHILRGWEEEHVNRIRVYSLREMPVFERMGYIARKIDALKPTAVFIDGLADLTIDFNDIEQSQDIIGRVSRIASARQCAIFFILHTNKNKNDNNMKGHLGTLATQKCSDIFGIERDEETNIFHVSETECRNNPIGDFFFKIDEDGIPYSVNARVYVDEKGNQHIKEYDSEEEYAEEAKPQNEQKKKRGRPKKTT